MCIWNRAQNHWNFLNYESNKEILYVNVMTVGKYLDNLRIRVVGTAFQENQPSTKGVKTFGSSPPLPPLVRGEGMRK